MKSDHKTGLTPPLCIEVLMSSKKRMCIMDIDLASVSAIFQFNFENVSILRHPILFLYLNTVIVTAGTFEP